MGLTYVSAFLELDSSPINVSTFIDNFSVVAETGVPIILYISKSYNELLTPLLEKCPNVRLAEVVELADTWTYAEFLNHGELALPPTRNEPKDRHPYMALQNAKTEFMVKAMQFDTVSTHFAWIDFRISYIFKNMEHSLGHLKKLAGGHWAEDLLVFPGCWAKGAGSMIDAVNWRYCGGFFAGSRGRINDLWVLTQEKLGPFLDDTKRALWEVNFWAWLEFHCPDQWNATWYKADHNDSMIRVPCPHFKAKVQTLADISGSSYTPIVYPSVLGMEPMSASYIKDKGVDVVNVRYINYRLNDQGIYDINHPNRWLVTRNKMCILDKDYRVYTSRDMNIGFEMQRHGQSIQGLEDIRLFHWKGRLCYIATQREWSACGRNRMIIGEYDSYEGLFTNSHLLEPPSDTWCEKNWIPLKRDDKLFLIYQWGPYMLGELTPDYKLSIVVNKPMPDFFGKIKGSTVPIRYGEHLWTVAHYSEGEIPRDYYHILVCIDPETLLPVKWCEPFIFRKIGIEYCIGFDITADGTALFWFSQKDREPGLMKVPVSAFNMKEI